MVEQGKSSDTKVLSVRVPVEEMQRIDADAKAAGMNRNDFIRMKVRQESTFADAASINNFIDVLRQLTLMMDAYLGILERLVGSLRESGGEEGLRLALAEIERADSMMRLILKTQREAAKVLRGARRDVRR